MIERNFNQDLKDKADAVYDNLSSLLNDDDFLRKYCLQLKINNL